jgi:aldehyde:ferredoxin oxidoreductase
MPNGYKGRILHVDLNKGLFEVEEPKDVWYRTYLGGGAMASYYLLKDLKPGTDPLSKENMLVFASGVVTGAPISGFSRYTVAAKSPLTNGYGESEAGGWWGPELKFAGYDGVVIRGRADHPVYLWIHDGDVEIRDASRLWGSDNGETRDRILNELGDQRIRIASIGPAGENQVRFANVINELRHANGRTGMGAVMGSKLLKAIAVRGKERIHFSDANRVQETSKWFNTFIRSYAPSMGLREYGTAGIVKGMNQAGMLPTRNFREGVFEGADRISGQAMRETILKGDESCFACAVRCKRVVAFDEPYPVDPKFGGPEYETTAAFGSLCGNDDLKAIARAHELCNRFGMDTISTGVVIAFAMECFEKSILTESETGGRPIHFGDAEAILWLIEEIAHRRGLGALLADGVRRASEKIGQGTEGFALHVKGQEVAMHEPRGKQGVALGYALSPTGADHNEAAHETRYQIPGPFLDQLAPLGILETIDPHSLGPDKVRAFSILQRVFDLYNSLGVCILAAAPMGAMDFSHLTDAVRAITGWETSLWELMRVGERANVMARVFNLREGIGPEEDRLFIRLYEALPEGPLKGARIDPESFQKAVQLYYQIKGWDAQGRPTPGKLVDLGLDWLIS